MKHWLSLTDEQGEPFEKTMRGLNWIRITDTILSWILWKMIVFLIFIKGLPYGMVTNELHFLRNPSKSFILEKTLLPIIKDAENALLHFHISSSNYFLKCCNLHSCSQQSVAADTLEFFCLKWSASRKLTLDQSKNIFIAIFRAVNFSNINFHFSLYEV